MCLARGCFLRCLCLVRKTGRAPFLYLSSSSFLVCLCFSPPRSLNSVAPGFPLGPRLYLQSFSPWAHLGSWWLSQMYVSSQKSTPELPIHTSACVQAPFTCTIHLNLTCASRDFSMWLLVTLVLSQPKDIREYPPPSPSSQNLYLKVITPLRSNPSAAWSHRPLSSIAKKYLF